MSETKHQNVWASRFWTEGQKVIFQAWYIHTTVITANTLDINYALVRWKIFWASNRTLPKYKHAHTHALHTLITYAHIYSTYSLSAPFSKKRIEWIRNKSLACIKKRLQGNIWSSQAAPCLPNIQRILLPQKCEYVMYSQVTKQIQQGIHKSSWEAVRHRQLPHASKIYNTPLIFASWFVCSIINKRDSNRCYHLVQFIDRGQRSHSPHAPSARQLCCIVIQCCVLRKWFIDFK